MKPAEDPACCIGFKKIANCNAGRDFQEEIVGVNDFIAL